MLRASSLTTAAITGGTSQWNDGAQATPSIAWASQPNTGFYKTGTSEIAASLNGNLTFKFTTTQLQLFVDTGALVLGASLDTKIGRQSAGLVSIQGSTATPAGGGAVGLVFGSTAGFGIYIGSGVPTLSAAQGSLYLRSDGSSTSTRLYVNTNGTTGWTNVTTAT